ncbi:thioredoxin domain-containing protein [Mycobacterium sp. 21AC1]|uniref:DsbA family protein n=1 Tax=[Mycobacterium] appelbergii TaxID=2939269 RepID=UPI002938E55E|nr:thioredoxin domain-containing protein [Mycobacterium sp. 21AC1]MDV3125454.1 thioredoxin domain-containing protein [Mycobacterium sp. 21AC1]
MRLSRTLGVVLAAVALTTGGCTRLIDGAAQANHAPPPSEITEDGAGILIGYPDAAVRIEVFTEPQCPACARLQEDFGAAMGDYIGQGELAVTYRPLTFLDRGTDYSARVSNAMFLAAGDGTKGAAFQAFVEDLWGHQQPEGSPGPTDDELADMARESGVGADQIDKIAAGTEGVDAELMSEQNVDLLREFVLDVGTPTIYNLVDDEQVDIDDDWLSQLMKRSRN